MILCRKIAKTAIFVNRRHNFCLNFAKFSTNTDIQDEKPSEQLEEILKKCEKKIIYSSYLERLVPKMSFVQKKIHDDKLKKQQYLELIEQQSYKQFPVALKFLEEETYQAVVEPKKEIIEETSVEEEENKYQKYHIPFSKAKKIWTEEKPEEKLEETIEKSEKLKEWMRDYEFYDEDEEDLGHLSEYGTPNPAIPISRVPCGGCGAHLHCADASLPGYIPSEIFTRCKKDELTTIVCQRCHFLKNYNTAINVTVTPEDYINIISSIQNKKALAVLMVDLLDMENSIWPGIQNLLGSRRPIIVVGNKVDLLPRDSPGHLNHVKKCVEKAIIEAGFLEENIKHIGLISATTGFGVESLITKIHHIWGSKGDVYIVGCTNVGKSSLFNSLLQSDFCNSEASNIVQRATASPWPGTTIRLLKFPILRPSDHRLYRRVLRLKQDEKINQEENTLRQIQANKTKNREYATLIGHIGRTFIPSKERHKDPFSVNLGSGNEKNVIPVVNENHEDYMHSKWCFDTPGVVHNEQILNLLTTEELLKVLPKEMINPRTYLFKLGMSLFLAGLARIDFLEGPDFVRAQIYSSRELPTLITKTQDADEMYETLYGSKILGVPFGSDERLAEFPKLRPAEETITVEGIDNTVNCADILLSSAGWLGISAAPAKKATFRVWTPEGRGIVLRQPALIPYGILLKGKRIRGSFAYKETEPFVSFRVPKSPKE
ncbi:nitric oxide-associated protein 1 [Culicoides brevitarsis]|uniref:nitric oxide-associated protein 1 n=1 Tax=Culicoides brevitarsis TaxID=469753 RepID=UPI00307C5B03